MNGKVYIHEFINITGHNRTRYMHHMAANWSPVAREERGQLCYGVWGVVGSTGEWPQVVNIWEEDGWEGLGRSFHKELDNRDLQDPKLARWWAAAADMRSGGRDRILVPAPWTSSIEELCDAGEGGAVYAHDYAEVAPGTASDYLNLVSIAGARFYERFGWHLIGAWQTALSNESEAFLLWTIPTWDQWAVAEKAISEDGTWRKQNHDATVRFNRILLVDSPLNPLRTGRQPLRSDRDDQWEE